MNMNMSTKSLNTINSLHNNLFNHISKQGMEKMKPIPEITHTTIYGRQMMPNLPLSMYNTIEESTVHQLDWYVYENDVGLSEL